ncbi:MAG: DUF3017 domain-containing protein [Nocardioides sp.]
MTRFPAPREPELGGPEPGSPEPGGPGRAPSGSESSSAAGYVPSRRWFPARLGGLCYLVVMVASILGLAIVALGAWRNGVRLVAAALLLAALLRTVLPEPQAGMLAVRHRLLDAGILATVGAVIVFLASSIPNQPPL